MITTQYCPEAATRNASVWYPWQRKGSVWKKPLLLYISSVTRQQHFTRELVHLAESKVCTLLPLKPVDY